jgi:hypothetical protein
VNVDHEVLLSLLLSTGSENGAFQGGAPRTDNIFSVIFSVGGDS